MKKIVDIRFKPAGRLYHFNANNIELQKGDVAIVEVEKGIGIGRVVVAPRVMEEGKLEHRLKKIVRKADDVDFERDKFNREREQEAFTICKEKINKYKLQMKLVEVEYLFDSSKAIFYFTSESRVDFRELVKDLAGCFYTRIEMRQIGVRDEAKHVGGLGPCGRELCCSSFLQEFAPVTVKMAKEQNIALNPLKISGVCGRLMCCLGYEVDKSKCAKRGGNKDRGRDNGGARKDSPGRDKGRDKGRDGREVRVDAGRAGKPDGKVEDKTEVENAAACGGCPTASNEPQDKSPDKAQDDSSAPAQTQAQPEGKEGRPEGQKSRRRGRSRGRRRAEKRARAQSGGGNDPKADNALMVKESALPANKPAAPLSIRKENEGGSN